LLGMTGARDGNSKTSAPVFGAFDPTALILRVNFDEGVAGGVVYSAQDGGVIARRQCNEDGIRALN
jgi:hypothetical protein